MAWVMYLKAGTMQWPLVRNHSDGFVTTCPNTGERVHTNGVEAVNSLVKVEEGHKFRLGKRPECRLNHIAAHAVLVNGRQKNRQSSPFLEILAAIRVAPNDDPETLTTQ